jgi:hypothetical protein
MTRTWEDIMRPHRGSATQVLLNFLAGRLFELGPESRVGEPELNANFVGFEEGLRVY